MRWQIANEARWAELAITNLISNRGEWNNCFIKNAPKYRKLNGTENKKAPKITRLLAIFAENGIINNYSMSARWM